MTDSPSLNLIRSETGKWDVEEYASVKARTEPSYFLDLFLRYMQCFDPLFTKARETCETEFLLALLGLKGSQDAGWNPFDTTRGVVSTVRRIIKGLEEFNSRRTLELWLYGHIVEASEPYEIIANLLSVVGGGQSRIMNFPPNPKTKAAQTPGQKVDALQAKSRKLGFSDALIPLLEGWDRDLRNSIFHSDFSIHGGELRILHPSPRKISNDDLLFQLNKAIARHDSLEAMVNFHIRSYSEPVKIRSHPNSHFGTMRVLIREGHGAVGVVSDYTEEQIDRGAIQVRLARLFPDENNLLEKERTRLVLPSRPI